ncbi:hypothetical protein [Cupriavidus nantongensis]|uniref:hypothetical protein n=1 Tax=Cupriavidus nantongensis TaxID=1796606 RepID=UPI0012B68F69|nr:hypothetical protein [Cupriavidus nantongensis]
MTASKKNPDWRRDELILALDLYLRHRQKLPGFWLWIFIFVTGKNCLLKRLRILRS